MPKEWHMATKPLNLKKCQHIHYIDVKSNEQHQRVSPSPYIIIKQRSVLTLFYNDIVEDRIRELCGRKSATY